jgi:lipooligosaccharide transport system permease protein
MEFRQTWQGSVYSTVLFPVFYLSAMGVGVGHLVSAHAGLVAGQTYLHFIAPGLLATTALQLGESESLHPVLAGLKWERSYHAIVSTPLEPRDLLWGKLAWLATRGLFTGLVYTIAFGAFGVLASWWALTLPLLGALMTVAIAAPLVAYAATCEEDTSFAYIYRFAVVPMTLFSATFYPLSAYPSGLQPIVQLMPLYHGVALTRSAAFGQGSLGPIVAHLAVLFAMVLAGLWWGQRTLTRRLVD